MFRLWLSSQRPRCFNNVILLLNKIILKAVVVRNYSPFIQRWGNLLCQKAWKTMQTVDWRPGKLRFKQTEKNPSKARVSGNRCNINSSTIQRIEDLCSCLSSDPVDELCRDLSSSLGRSCSHERLRDFYYSFFRVLHCVKLV